MQATQLIEDISKIGKSYFPESYIVGEFSKTLGASIDIRFAFGKDKTEWQNGIIYNDPLHHIFFIGHYQMDAEGNLNKELTAEMILGKKKYKFRKKTGTYEQILKHFDTYFKRMATSWMQQY